jgi:quinoprotein glucose dehydrogenase
VKSVSGCKRHLGIVLLALAAPVAAGQDVSINDGVYTEEQANRGKAAYATPCGWCHGRRLNGAPDDPDMQSTPPLARAKFIRNWQGKTLAVLFVYIRETMPTNNPRSLTDQEYIDIVAYMLATSGMPAGERELSPDPSTLANIIIR